MEEFRKLGLTELTIEALEKKGFTKPTPIQTQTIPLLLQGEFDVIGQAQTGTGKTACFALPILEKLQKTKKVQAIILAPTRELAIQVAKETKSLAGTRKVRVTAIYGGSSIRDQIDELKKEVQIVVGTPGRVMDLIKREKLDISEVSYAVLDEADEMLNMGFIDDIEMILSKTNEDKKMLLFSATMPKEIQRIAKRFMTDYKLIKVQNKSLATDLIEQVYYDIMGRERLSAIKKIVGITPNFHGLIFCKTRAEVDTVAKKLSSEKYSAAALHGDIAQNQRENILKAFREKRLTMLIATDVAARGIDVNDLNVVINYSLPQSAETYVHRIGRTGRAGNKGKAITFLIPSEKGKLKFVERIINQPIPKGKLPTIGEIIAVKKLQIEETITEMVKTTKKTEYDEIAKKLIENNDNPEKVVAAVLKYAFTNELDSSKYKNQKGSSDDSSYGSKGRERRPRSGKRSDRRSGDRRSSGRGSRGGSDRQSFSSRSNNRSPRRDSKRNDRRSSDRGSPERRRSSDRQRNFSGREDNKRSSDRSSRDRAPRRDSRSSSQSFKPRSEKTSFRKPSENGRGNDSSRSSRPRKERNSSASFKRQGSLEKKSYNRSEKQRNDKHSRDKPRKSSADKRKDSSKRKEERKKGSKREERRPLRTPRKR